VSASALFDSLAPHLANDPNKNTHLALAAQNINPCFYGNNTAYVTALLAAHTLTLSNRAGSSAGASGNITSIKEGDLAISYGGTASGGSGGGYNTTTYGQQLEDLRKSSSGPSMGVTGGNDRGCIC